MTANRKRTVNDLLNQSPKPSIEKAMASTRVQENANRSMLPQRPYAQFVEGFGWVLDSVSEVWAQYNPLPDGYEVTVIPEGFWL